MAKKVHFNTVELVYIIQEQTFKFYIPTGKELNRIFSYLQEICLILNALLKEKCTEWSNKCCFEAAQKTATFTCHTLSIYP